MRTALHNGLSERMPIIQASVPPEQLDVCARRTDKVTGAATSVGTLFLLSVSVAAPFRSCSWKQDLESGSNGTYGYGVMGAK